MHRQMKDLKICKIVSMKKNCLAQHIEPTFLAADLAIYSIYSFYVMSVENQEGTVSWKLTRMLASVILIETKKDDK